MNSLSEVQSSECHTFRAIFTWHGIILAIYVSFAREGINDFDAIIKFIMQKDGNEFSNNCDQCSKKEKLIEKYLSLIDLLKKKSDKSLMSTTLRRSTDACPDNNSSLSSPLPRAALPFTLLALAHRRKGEALLHFKQLDLEARCHKGYMFVQTIEKMLQKRVIQTAKKLFTEGGARAGRDGLLERDRSWSRNQANQSYCSLSVFLEGEKREKLRALTRRVFELSQEVALLRVQKRSSDEQVEENLRRQQVQSKKKKESLEMLAEEMAEKNQVIAELQATIRFYEERQGKMDNNVLEEDGLALKRELEQMEKLNDKLAVELERKSEQLQRSEEELTRVKERAAKVQAQYAQLKEKNFEMGIELQDIGKRRQEAATLGLFLQKKMNSLKKYERLIAANLRALEQASLSDRSSFNSSLRPRNSRLAIDDPPPSETQMDEKGEFAPISRFQAQYKIEKILNYLYNIDLEDVWINNEEQLFDNEEITVLNELKLKFIRLQEQLRPPPAPTPPAPAQPLTLPPARLSKHCGESDEVYFNEQHVSGSIFDVFASEKANKEQAGKSVSEFGGGAAGGEATTRRAEQGFTIKLLQMEIEKNKQVEKISELKNKLFHIRSIVMNLIKSLELRALRPESKDIIDVCFQFFQYSEEEKEIIFHTQPKKQKRFLGLF